MRFEGSVDLTADGTSRRLRREASPRRGRLPVVPDLAARSRTRVPKYPLRGLPSGRASSSPSPRSRAPRKPSLTLLDQR
ncbi:hypothetical protein HMPREF9404_4207 [Eggerthella sp. HGA1]|nr:hypothetical protein HMPREF9404_4207 [Eggerthella sp. HGA1]